MALIGRPFQTATGRTRFRRSVAGLTIIEMMISLSIIAVIAAIMLPALGRAREAALRTYCMNNMREMGRFFLMRSGETKGMYPAGAPNHVWGEDLGTVSPENRFIRNNYILDPADLQGYLKDYKVLVCRGARLDFPYSADRWFTDLTLAQEEIDPKIAANPKFVERRAKIGRPKPDAECLTNQMYFYIPYAVATEGEMLYMLNELDNRMAAGQIDFMRDDLPCSVRGQGTGGRNSFFRVSDGVERMFITDVNNPAASYKSQSKIPVLFDQASHWGHLGFNHIVGLGGNVLYMDGSVGYVRYSEASTQIPYTRDLVEWMRRNAYNNRTLEHVPPWCANRAPGTAFEPRYKYYPSDPLYTDLVP